MKLSALFLFLISFFLTNDITAQKPSFTGIDEITIRLFESGDSVTPYNQREYKNVFAAVETRYINTEINVKNLLYEEKEQSYNLTWKWVDTMGLEKGEAKGKIIIDPSWKYAYNNRGWGRNTPGGWFVGKYIAEVYIDKKLAGSKVFYVVPLKYKDQEIDDALWRKIDAEYNYDMAVGFLSTASPEVSVPFFSIAANKGHAMAQYYLGYFFLTGQYGARNEQSAMKWLSEAANNGITKSFYSLGYLYTLWSIPSGNTGYSVNYADYQKKAYYWLYISSYYAQKGDTTAASLLSTVETMLDSSERKKLKSKAYDFLTDMYIKKYGEKEYADAKEILLPLTFTHDGWAEYNMGQLYQWGLGVDKNDTIAMSWYKKAATDNYANAYYRIGSYYVNGTLQPKDIAKAIEYYKKGIEAGSGDAVYQLAWLYYDGKDIQQDYPEALRLFLKGSDMGNVKSLSMAGYMYEMGLGTEKNQTLANSLYKMAAEKGNAAAQYNMGLIYEFGKGTETDQDEALKWYMMSAKQDDADAQYKVGYLLEKKNRTQDAKYWYKRAVKAGNTDAKEALERLNQQ